MSATDRLADRLGLRRNTVLLLAALLLALCLSSASAQLTFGAERIG